MNELKICKVCGKSLVLVPSPVFGWVWKCPDETCKGNIENYTCTINSMEK